MKRPVTAPGDVTLARTIAERAGAKDFTVVELPIGQHVAAIASGRIDAAYTLEPTGTIGRLDGTTRDLEAGVVAKYVRGDPMAPWQAARPAPAPLRQTIDRGVWLPLAGPIAFYLVWDVVVRLDWIKAILLPPPGATLLTLTTGMAGGTLLPDFLVTLQRTPTALAMAAAAGMALGIPLSGCARRFRWRS